MDLHMEHLNRQLKPMLRNMGSNITEGSVTLGQHPLHVLSNI